MNLPAGDLLQQLDAASVQLMKIWCVITISFVTSLGPSDIYLWDFKIDQYFIFYIHSIWSEYVNWGILRYCFVR